MSRFCRNKSVLLLTGIALVATASVGAYGQSFPSKPVKVIVPYAAGGGTDMLARLVSQKLSEKWAQPVVIDNKPGADAMIGTEQAAHARPDGYTLLFIAPSHVLNPGMRASMPYDTVKSFSAVAMVGSTPFALVVNNQVPVKSVKELVALAKAQPGKLTFGSAESSSRLAGELFKSLSGTDIVNVQYKSLATELTDIVGGHIHMGFASLTSVLQFHKAGSVRLLGVSGNLRSPLVPEIATVSEGGLPGYDVAAWYGFVAPAGTPITVISKIQQDVVQVIAMPEVKASMVQLGIVPSGISPEQFQSFIELELVKSAKIIKTAGIKAE